MPRSSSTIRPSTRPSVVPRHDPASVGPTPDAAGWVRCVDVVDGGTA